VPEKGIVSLEFRCPELRQTVLDPVVGARLIERMNLARWPEMRCEERRGERCPIVSQDGVNTKRAIGNQVLKKLLGDGLRHPLLQLDIGIVAEARSIPTNRERFCFPRRISVLSMCTYPMAYCLNRLFFRGCLSPSSGGRR